MYDLFLEKATVRRTQTIVATVRRTQSIIVVEFCWLLSLLCDRAIIHPNKSMISDIVMQNRCNDVKRTIDNWVE